MYKACFLDRDGVLIEEEDYLCDPAKARLCPGAVEAIKLAHSVGWKVILISNQAGIAKGKFKMEDLKAVHAKVEELLANQGVALDGYYYCPHHAKGIVPEYTRECPCRKPGPGMILKAAEEHDLDAYIAGLNELLVTEKDSFQAQQILRINLTVAYWGKHDFANALKALQEIPDPKRLNRPNAAFYWVNLGLANFYNGNDEEGLRILDLQKAAFTEMRKVPQPSPSLAFLEIFETFHAGSVEDAHALFETARATWENSENAPEFALVAEKIGAEFLPLPEKTAATEAPAAE